MHDMSYRNPWLELRPSHAEVVGDKNMRVPMAANGLRKRQASLALRYAVES